MELEKPVYFKLVLTPFLCIRNSKLSICYYLINILFSPQSHIEICENHFLEPEAEWVMIHIKSITDRHI